MATTTRDVMAAGAPAATMTRPRTAATTLSSARLVALPWYRLALGAVLALAAALNFWALDRLGYANSYYAAAVRSMLTSWHNFFFVSFDPGGFVSIDKPPLGFWLQAASAKLFGYSGVSLLLPEALAGVLAVAVLYRLVARAWGRGAGLLAALFLAVTPVSVVTARNNTIDSLLVLTTLLAAWAVTRAAASGRLRPLLLCAVLVGLGFNIKMLEAYLVVPAFGLVYLLGARAGWRKRLAHLALAAVALLVVSLSWATAVDLTPAALRPYVGSSGTNSALNLALGYNGLQRLLGGAGTPGGGGGPGGGASGVNLFNGGPAGPFRLLGTTLGDQVSWLLIPAVLGLLFAATRVPWRRLRSDERGRSLLLWGGWLLTAGAFFSVAEFFHPYYTTMLAPAVAAPAAIGVAALWRAYRAGGRSGWLLPVALLAGAAAQAYLLRDYPAWGRWLTPLVVGVCLVAALTLVAARLRPRRMARVALAALGVAVAALVAAPTTWAAYSTTHTVNASIPTAGPSAQSSGGGQGGFGGPGGAFRGGNPGGAPPSGNPGSAPSGAGAFRAGANGGAGNGPGGDMGGQADTALIAYLKAHQGGATYLVATASSQSASSIIIATGKPVMALGGFSGNDQILTMGQLATLVKNGTVRYFLVQGGGAMAGGAPAGSASTAGSARGTTAARAGAAQTGATGAPSGVGGGPGGNSALTQWVSKTCTAVPLSQYRASSTSTTSTTSTSSAGGFGQAATLYYCGGTAATTAGK